METAKSHAMKCMDDRRKHMDSKDNQLRLAKIHMENADKCNAQIVESEALMDEYKQRTLDIKGFKNNLLSLDEQTKQMFGKYQEALQAINTKATALRGDVLKMVKELKQNFIFKLIILITH